MKKMAFKKWVENIHAKAYNGTRTIFLVAISFIKEAKISSFFQFNVLKLQLRSVGPEIE